MRARQGRAAAAGPSLTASGKLLFHAAAASGLEPAVAAELSWLDIPVLEAARGVVRFEASPEEAARAALALRSAPRLALELARGLPVSPADLVPALAAIPWEEWLPAETTWAARVVGTTAELRDVRYTALLVKDALRDRMRARGLPFPEVDPEAPQIVVELRVTSKQATVGLDLAGGSLHERGTFRRGEAPLREDVAAGICVLAGVDRTKPILDPFCGTGSVIAEAASLALRRPPRRNPAAMALARLPAFADVDLRRVVLELRAAALPPEAPILAFDRQPRMVGEARAAFRAQKLDDVITLTRGEVADLELPDGLAPGLVVSNPPWGLRLDADEAAAAWRGLGQLARRALGGWRLALLSGAPEVTRNLGFKASRRFPVVVGGIESRLLLYDVHARP